MVKWQCMDCVRRWCAAALCLVLIICRLVIETQPWLLLKHREVIRPVQIYSEITGAASGKNASFNYPGFFLAWAGGGGSSSEQDRDRGITLHTLDRENKPGAQHCHQDHQTPLALRGHSQMTSQHWTTNGNLKSWRKLMRGTKGHQ